MKLMLYYVVESGRTIPPPYSTKTWVISLDKTTYFKLNCKDYRMPILPTYYRRAPPCKKFKLVQYEEPNGT